MEVSIDFFRSFDFLRISVPLKKWNAAIFNYMAHIDTGSLIDYIQSTVLNSMLRYNLRLKCWLEYVLIIFNMLVRAQLLPYMSWELHTGKQLSKVDRLSCCLWQLMYCYSCVPENSRHSIACNRRLPIKSLCQQQVPSTLPTTF